MNARENRGKTMRALVLALGVATVAASTTAPAFADDYWYRNDRAWRAHEWREHVRRERERRIEARRREEWRERHAYAYDYRYAPGYFYQPPHIFYPRPPSYVE